MHTTSIALSATAHNNIVVFGYRFSNKKDYLIVGRKTDDYYLLGVLVYTGFILKFEYGCNTILKIPI